MFSGRGLCLEIEAEDVCAVVSDLASPDQYDCGCSQRCDGRLSQEFTISITCSSHEAIKGNTQVSYSRIAVRADVVMVLHKNTYYRIAK